MREVGVWLGCAVMLACTGKAIDVGPMPPPSTSGATTGGTGGAGPAKLPPPAWPDPDECVAASNAPITGVWKGYVESNGAPWDKLTLVIHGAVEGGAVCGTLTVGEGTPPAPATDPEAGYPPGVTRSMFAHPVMPGFVYTLLGGTLQDARLRFGIGTGEAWRSWCELQTPVVDELNGPNFYCARIYWSAMCNGSSCVQTNPATGEQVVIGQGKLELCTSRTCLCDEKRCEADFFGGGSFDVHLSGAEADGSFAGGGRARFFRSE